MPGAGFQKQTKYFEHFDDQCDGSVARPVRMQTQFADLAKHLAHGSIIGADLDPRWAHPFFHIFHDRQERFYLSQGSLPVHPHRQSKPALGYEMCRDKDNAQRNREQKPGHSSVPSLHTAPR